MNLFALAKINYFQNDFGCCWKVCSLNGVCSIWAFTWRLARTQTLKLSNISIDFLSFSQWTLEIKDEWYWNDIVNLYAFANKMWLLSQQDMSRFGARPIQTIDESTTFSLNKLCLCIWELESKNETKPNF